ncbi:HlyD family efflux transporter periplasmic adaptor subunit [Flavobacterium franklandianum]|uniref:HlyD family efflux transporter periplasmic adaptor subunit n=1 Tax=Flavobacterium franklandianum TaxID=2594430 RepID=UPI00117A03C1|nr:HlyD family efflux transporter periplasmic adaptor subunit [Flavobacterium franklandianum]TRX26597.1 HlyD family efflux transporter periplasmic adaptor subunit [Flavobacterium franklandianum]
MDNKALNKKHTANRTEEVAYIIEKMPTRFGLIISSIVIGLTALLFLFGWLIKYPEILKGQITVNTRQAPIKLSAGMAGNLILLRNKAGTAIKAGEYIAYIKNSADLKDVQLLDSLLNQVNIHTISYQKHRDFFPENLSLGDLNNKYYSYLNALYQFLDYSVQQPFTAQKDINTKLLQMQKVMLQELQNDYKSQKIKYKTSQSLFGKDSILFSKNVIAKADIERSIISKTNSELDFKSIDKQITNTNYQINDAQNKLQILAIQKIEKERELAINLYNSYYDLADNIRKWEHNYVFVSPINGKADFLNFLKNNDFVQSGQELFKIIPNQNEMIGQVYLPENGSGKIKIGQSVIIKLDNYPYNEYGSIRGKVTAISIATNQQTLSDSQNKINAYLVNVSLPNGLKTNYGTELTFHTEAKGFAEIITEDKRLINRFFDNLKYKVK